MYDDFQSRITGVSKITEKYTYPLMRYDSKGLPQSIASCVFVMTAEHVYLVTAAHALRGNQSGLLTRGNGYLIDLAGHATISRSDKVDHFDIGALRIDDQFVREHEISVVPYSMFSSAVEVTGAHARAISGFPASMNKQIKSLDKSTNTVTGKCFTYVGSADFEGDFLEFGKSPEVHIGLEMLPGNDDAGTYLSTVPSPKGISGGGAWLVPDLSKPKQIFLEGIFIECHKRNKTMYAFSTRLEFVADFINQTHNK